MGFKKILKDAMNFLDLDNFSVEGKKKTIKNLLTKLENRKKSIKKELHKAKSKKEKKHLEEDLELVSLQIKKSKKYLDKLDKK